MESNREESERCLEIAITALRLGNIEKARKMLKKSDSLFPSEAAKSLLESLQNHSHNQTSSSSADTESNVRHRRKTSVPEVEEKPYTKDQLEIVNKVKKCKDYYEVLGVTTEATDSQIKKAYKKLALLLHPDKNSAPGAAEAFKKIGKANTVLTDVEKRKNYDLYGPEDVKKVSNSSSSFFEEGDFFEGSPFDAYFNADFFNSYSSYHSHGHQRQRRFHNRHEHGHRGEMGDHQQMTFALILMVIVVLSMTTFFRSDPPYSLSPSSEYSVAKHTSNFRIPYYVKSSFDTEYQGSVPRLELAVEEQYVVNMKNSCIRERNYREMMMARARSFGNKAQFVHAQEMKTPSCDNLYRIGKYY